MNPLGTRARSEELSRVLDGVFAGPVPAGPMASYAATAGRLRTAGVALAPATAPRPEFRAALRTRLVAVAAVQAHNASVAAPVVTAKPRALEAAVSWSQSRRTQRGMGVAAGAMASVVAVAGIAVAGSQSLPGDPFYGVKKGTESLELRAAGSDVDKGTKHLEFAAERLREVRGLALGRDAALGPIAPGTAGALGGSISERVRETLAAMDAETRKGSALLTEAYRDSNDEAPLEILTSFADTQSDDLRELIPSLPTAARTRAEQSLALVSTVAVQTSQLLAVGVCTDSCSPTAPAPQLPTGNQPAPQPAPTATTDAPCGCETVPTPSPTSAPSPEPAPQPTESPEPQPDPTRSAAPSPSPSASSNPLPAPIPSLPVPVPSLPVPIPTLSPLPVLPGATVPVPVVETTTPLVPSAG